MKDFPTSLVELYEEFVAFVVAKGNYRDSDFGLAEFMFWIKFYKVKN